MLKQVVRFFKYMPLGMGLCLGVFTGGLLATGVEHLVHAELDHKSLHECGCPRRDESDSEKRERLEREYKNSEDYREYRDWSIRHGLGDPDRPAGTCRDRD